MKKVLILLLSLLVLFGLAACNQNDAQLDEKNPSVTENKKPSVDNRGVKEEEKEESKPPKVDEGNNNKEEDPTNEETKQPNTIYANNSFKDVIAVVQGDTVLVTGKARVFEGTFQYALVVDENTLREDHYQTEGAPTWGSFELTFSTDELSPGTELELYFYSAEDGSKTDSLLIPLVHETQKPLHANNSFKVMDVKTSRNEVVIKGHARVFEGVFQYALIVSDQVIEENHYQTAGAPAWGDFELSIPSDKITTEDAHLELFYFSAKDGSKKDSLQVPLVKEEK